MTRATLLLLFFLWACGQPAPLPPPPPPKSRPVVVTSAPVLLQGTHSYASYQGATGVYYGLDEMHPERAAKVAHIEIDFVNDLPTEIREVAPSGRVERTISITRDAPDLLVLQKDRFGVVEQIKSCSLEFLPDGAALTCYGSTGSKRPLYLGCPFWKERINKKRQITRLTCLDAEGAPTRSAEGWAFWEYTYDAAGREVERRALDTDERLVSIQTGHAIVQSSYNRAGRLREERFLQPNEISGRGPDGVAIVRYGYDRDKCDATLDSKERQRCLTNVREVLVSELYFNGAERPEPALHGAYQLQLTRDANGDVMEWRYLDRDGSQQTPTPQRCTRIEATLNSQGLASKRSCLDQNGAPSTQDGVYQTTFLYDPKGRPIEERYLDTQGAPVTQGLCFGVRYEYDDFDRLTKEICLDSEGKPFQPKGFYCQAIFSYDPKGFMSRKDEQDCQGKLTTERAGVASTVYERDEDGRIRKLTNLNAEGLPYRAGFGYSQERWSYNEIGLRQEISFWHQDTPIEVKSLCFDGKMCTNTDEVPPLYHKMVFFYSGAGERLMVQFFTKDGLRLGERDCTNKYCP